ncbi:hypothetical protein AURDEDRAFT_188286 [Auricularia subglabra TFB-10046 SS5]|nr:hypothetical protein AURDEDRAFT_188286 [Auricularia subglabra TFB-10046 SS5]
MDWDATHAAMYNHVQVVLNNVTNGRQLSSIDIEGLLDALRTAVTASCADFAEIWNDQHVHQPQNLPNEILAMCFREARFDALLSASQVCRRWRAVALADRTLWTTYRRTEIKVDPIHPAAVMANQLSAMLERSHPYPFDVTLPSPRETGRSTYTLDVRVSAILGPKLERIQKYDGSVLTFAMLNPDGQTMIRLRSLRLTAPARSKPFCELFLDWGAGRLPRLSELDLEGLVFVAPKPGPPLYALEKLKCNASPSVHAYPSLFQRCPNLMSLELREVTEATLLPPGPLPPSLHTVSLYIAEGVTTDFSQLLEAWTGSTIQKLTLYGSTTLSHPLGLFLSSCTGPIELATTSNCVSMARETAPPGQSDIHHVVYPYSWAHQNQFLALHGECAARLAFISIHLQHLDEFFATNLTAPVLSTFEVALHDAPPRSLIPGVLPKPSYGLSAPQLRGIVIWVPRCLWSELAGTACPHTMHMLATHLRDLIAYDAVLLDKITVHSSRHILTMLGGASLAPLARVIEIKE